MHLQIYVSMRRAVGAWVVYDGGFEAGVGWAYHGVDRVTSALAHGLGPSTGRV